MIADVTIRFRFADAQIRRTRRLKRPLQSDGDAECGGVCKTTRKNAKTAQTCD
jgi:hypothetical protein